MILNVPLSQWLRIGLFLSITIIQDIFTAQSTRHDANSGFIGSNVLPMYSEEESIVSVMHKKAKDNLANDEIDPKVDLNSTALHIKDDERAKRSNESLSEELSNGDIPESEVDEYGAIDDGNAFEIVSIDESNDEISEKSSPVISDRVEKEDTIRGDSSDENVDEYIVIDEFNGSDTMSKGNEADDKTLKPSHMMSDRVENEKNDTKIDYDEEQKKPDIRDALNSLQRWHASLGNASDFPSDWRENALHQIDIGRAKIHGEIKRTRFRSGGRRALLRKRNLERVLKRWDHKEGINKEDPAGCGFPICVDVDMRPKSFESMCSFTKWLKENGHERRIFEVQKGGCEDVIDNKKEIKKSTWVPITNGYHNGQNYGGHAQPNHAKRHKRSSSSYDNGNTLHNPCQDHHMHNFKEHPVCNVPICINAFHVGEHGIANSFENVMSAMAWFKLLGQKEAGEKLLRQTVVIAVGLGKCDQLYKGNLLTEYFDFDDPCVDPESNDNGDGEDIIAAWSFLKAISYSDMVKNTTTGLYYKETREIGRHRTCLKEHMGPIQIETVQGRDKQTVPAPYQVLQQSTWSSKCFNKDMPEEIPDPPYYWDNTLKVRCIDWRYRFECKDMWGEVHGVKNLIKQPGGNEVKEMTINEEHDVIVDKPSRTKGIFEGCNWMPFVSNGHGRKNDIELRTIIWNNKKIRKHICGNTKMDAMFIDARTMDNDVPWDETQDYKDGIITKNTPFSGFYCESENKKGTRCKDYKVRFCCIKPKKTLWENWGQWSECTKECGGGTKFRTRNCPSTDPNESCRGSDLEDHHKQELPCNQQGCKVDYEWEDWTAWSSCSVSCGDGIKNRHRGCKASKHGGQKCPEDNHKMHNDYRETKHCFIKKCPVFTWAEWTKWSQCSSRSDYGGGDRKRVKCGRIGTRESTRFCNNKNSCDQRTYTLKGFCKEDPKTRKEESCAGDPCVVHGGWSEWYSWSECNVDCGNGTQTSTRDCSKPFPLNGGKPCEGERIREKGCEKGPCPVNCLWSEWGQWSKCSATCGDKGNAGNRERYRHIAIEAQHGGLPCEADTPKETEECIHCKIRPDSGELEFRPTNETYHKENCIPFCPINCEWSAWSPWDDYDCKNPSCLHHIHQKHQRDKTKTRRRVVSHMEMYGGRPCKTNDGKIITDHSFRETVENPCDTPKCPKVAAQPYWSAWKDWGPCEDVAETPCYEQEPNLGIRKRTRECQIGRKRWSYGQPDNLKILGHEECKKRGLHGTTMEEEKCTPPCGSFPPWGDWTSWSPCSATCGYGKKHRSRRCNALPRIDGTFEKCEIGKRETENQMCDMGACGHYQGVKEPHYGSEGEQSYQKTPEEEGGNYHQGMKEPDYLPEGDHSYKKASEEKGGNNHQGVKEPHYRSEGEQAYKKSPEEKGGNYHQGMKEPQYRPEGEQSYKESAEEKGGNYHQGVTEPKYRSEGEHFDNKSPEEKKNRKDDWKVKREPKQINRFPNTNAVKEEFDPGYHQGEDDEFADEQEELKEIDQLPPSSPVKVESDERFYLTANEAFTEEEKEEEQIDQFPDTSAVKVEPDSRKQLKSNENLDEYQNYEMEDFEEVEPQYSSIEEDFKFEEA